MRRLLIVALAVAGLLVGAAGQARAENIVALTAASPLNAQFIIDFDSLTPGSATLPRIVTGLQTGETLVGIDRRPANGLIYGLSNQNRVYTINAATGVASAVSTLDAAQSGAAFGTDFNPVPDRLRVTSNADQNLRINVDTGATILDGTLAFASGDVNFGTNPNIVGAAYTNNFAGATTTTLYGIDSNLDALVIQNPPNDGVLNTVGSLGFNTSDLVGFDISGQTGLAYVTLTAPGAAAFSSFYTINLATGAVSLVGQIRLAGVPNNGFRIIGIAAPTGASPIPEPATLMLLGAGLAGVAAKVRKRRKT